MLEERDTSIKSKLDLKSCNIKLRNMKKRKKASKPASQAARVAILISKQILQQRILPILE